MRALAGVAVAYLLGAAAVVTMFVRQMRKIEQAEQRETEHSLSEPSLHSTGYYHSRCECGMTIHGMSLPEVWAAHDRHLEKVREQQW